MGLDPGPDPAVTGAETRGAAVSPQGFYFTVGPAARAPRAGRPLSPGGSRAGTGETGTGREHWETEAGQPASLVSAEHVAEEVHHSVTVAIFVVIPGEGGMEGIQGIPPDHPQPPFTFSDPFLPPYQEMSFTKLSLSVMPPLASKIDK